ncbi:MAG TPA: ABC transporter permease, partial [Vicinamibacteria bacterium]|nr:ABC transporter permease [Vicinamibacteria bacterium]
MSARDWAGRLHLPTLAVLVVVLVGWTLLSRRYGAYVLPAPGSIVTGFAEIVRSGEIWTHAAASLSRIAVGFGLAIVLSLLMGLGAFASRTARGIVTDLLAILNSTSVFVWIV